MPYQALIRGYILMPRFFLEENLFNGTEPMTEVEAFIALLIKVNYKEATCVLKDKKMVCHRGESLNSYRTWAEIFRWNKTKTIRFIHDLIADEVIELIPCNKLTTHLRVIAYNEWTGCQYEARQQEKEKMDERFEEFWIKFHRITRTPKMNRGKAEKEWRKMTVEQRELAIKGIQRYYLNLPDIKYCKQAATYLSDKAYLNE